MFYVINKSKIYSYMIALSTVVILFVAAATLNDMEAPLENTVQTTTNTISINEINSIVNE